VALVCLALLWLAPSPADEADVVAMPATMAQRRAGSALAVTAPPVMAPVASAPARLTDEPASADPFQARSWLPPPPPVKPMPVLVAAPAASVAPVAPPVPFGFMGRMEAGAGAPKVFLTHKEALVVAGVGDVIDKLYRVEDISAQGVTLLYLPLQVRQTISLPGGAR
jgi:hypothetical protein